MQDVINGAVLAYIVKHQPCTHQAIADGALYPNPLSAAAVSEAVHDLYCLGKIAVSASEGFTLPDYSTKPDFTYPIAALKRSLECETQMRDFYRNHPENYTLVAALEVCLVNIEQLEKAIETLTELSK